MSADPGLAPEEAHWIGSVRLAEEINPQVRGWINYLDPLILNQA